MVGPTSRVMSVRATIFSALVIKVLTISHDGISKRRIEDCRKILLCACLSSDTVYDAIQYMETLFIWDYSKIVKGIEDFLKQLIFLLCRGVAQPGRALRSGRGGRRFKSSRPDHFIFLKNGRSS